MIVLFGLIVFGLIAFPLAMYFAFPLFASIGRKLGTVWMAGAMIAIFMLFAGISWGILFQLLGVAQAD